MPETISAIIYALLAQFIGYLLILNIIPIHMVVRAAVVWIGSMLALQLLAHPNLVLTVSGLLLICAAPSRRIDRAAFFLIAVPAVPIFVELDLVIPGVGNFLRLDYYKLCVLICLVPLLLLPRARYVKNMPGVSAFLLSYTIYVGLTVCLYANITSGIRSWISIILVFFLPLFAIARSVHSPNDIDKLIRAFVAGSLMLAAVACVSAFKQWDFYKVHAPAIVGLSDFRSGFLRVEATANTHSLGFHVGAGWLLLEYLKWHLGSSKQASRSRRHQPRSQVGASLFVNVARFFLLVALLMTDSRGALLGTLIGFVVYLIAINRSRFLRRLYAMGSVVGLVAVALWVVLGNFSSLGIRDSFTYRQRLLETSIDFIRDNFLLGDLNFISTGRFDSLVQGQGIIDITNQYLLIAIQFGFIGSVLYWGGFLLCARLLLFSRQGVERRPSSEAWRDSIRLRGMVLGGIAGWLFLLATTSDVALTVHIGLVLAALALCVASKFARVRSSIAVQD